MDSFQWNIGYIFEWIYISPWAHIGPHAPPPPMIHHEWYQIVQWTLRNDLSDVFKLVHATMAVILLNDRLTAPENH